MWPPLLAALMYALAALLCLLTSLAVARALVNMCLGRPGREDLLAVLLALVAVPCTALLLAVYAGPLPAAAFIAAFALAVAAFFTAQRQGYV